MKIAETLAAKQANNWGNSGVTIACLGDSVTQGCFELYYKHNGDMETVFEQEYAYHSYLKTLLAKLYPGVPINIINAGISAGNAVHGLDRLERDVLRYRPDLVVVCFGLNDVWQKEDGLERYLDSLKRIFTRLKAEGIETIFMTPNMMNTSVSCRLEPDFRDNATDAARLQTEGTMDLYMGRVRELCAQEQITVCDCYGRWKKLMDCGVDINELLANRINHPRRDMNWLFAVSLLETMLEL